MQYLINSLANFLKQIEELFDSNKVILSIKKSVQLNSYSCGIHCAFVILRHYNKLNSINDINYDKILLKNDGIDTEPLLNIIRYFDCKISVNKNALISDIVIAINNNKLILLSVDDGAHWVVIYGYSLNSIYVLDPSLSSAIKCKWKLKTFINRWDENWIASISL